MTTVGKVQVEEIEKTEFNFEWRIDDFFSLSNKAGKDYNSPHFLIDGEYWYLNIFPNGDSEDNSVGYVSVYFCRESDGDSKRMEWTFSLKTVDGKKYCEKQKSYPFELAIGSGLPKFLKRSELIKNKSTLVPNGVLTVVCTKESCSKSTTYDSGSQDTVRYPLPNSGNKKIYNYKELFFKYCDVIIKVKEQEFQAHRGIMSARSTVFASILRNDPKDGATETIDIEDCDPATFSEFLCFIYSGNVENLSTANVFDLFTLADKYQVEEFRAACLEFIKYNLSVDIFCDSVALAVQHSEKELIRLAADFLTKHFEEITVTEKLKSLLIKNPIADKEIMIKALVHNK